MARKHNVQDEADQPQAPVETVIEAAQRRAREAREAKEKQRSDLKAVAMKKAEALMAGYKPMILPYKDRDGKIVPCIVISENYGFKKLDNGDSAIDPKTRELIPEYQMIVWVFGGASVPHQATYKFDE